MKLSNLKEMPSTYFYLIQNYEILWQNAERLINKRNRNINTYENNRNDIPELKSLIIGDVALVNSIEVIDGARANF